MIAVSQVQVGRATGKLSFLWARSNLGTEELFFEEVTCSSQGFSVGSEEQASRPRCGWERKKVHITVSGKKAADRGARRRHQTRTAALCWGVPGLCTRNRACVSSHSTQEAAFPNCEPPTRERPWQVGGSLGSLFQSWFSRERKDISKMSVLHLSTQGSGICAEKEAERW